MNRLFIFLLPAIVLIGCKKQEDKRGFPLYPSLSGFHMKLGSTNPKAQQYFDQGMALYFGFNHEAAISSFHEAAILDSSLAMAWWGQAISAGPNINNPAMDSTAAYNAWDAAQRAVHLSKNAPVLEQDLCRAIAARYKWPQPDDRKSLDIAYADVMRVLWKKYPNNDDIGVLFADAMMNLRPWDLWTAEGIAQPGTPEIVATLEKVLSRNPTHPGACHFYIHTMEASPVPQKALQAADRLGGLLPGAGHLVHMPSHIYIRLGMYDAAVIANQKAILADTTWIKYGGFYTLYRAHNYHFLTYAAMFDGRKALAMEAAREMLVQIPMEMVRAYPDFMDAYLAIPYHVMVRFGLWEEMLKEPRPATDLTATTAFWRYARCVSLSALGRTAEATAEYDSLETAISSVQESRLLGNNSVITVLQIGLKIAEGELAYRKGNYDRAFALLEEAVQKDDALKYDEPWGWMMPARHALGALLLEQGKVTLAESVYRKDLEIHPGNGWALKGLHDCQVKTGNAVEAAKTQAQFELAWKRADIMISTSCYCSRGNQVD